MNDRLTSNWQRRVATFLHQHHLQYDPATHALDLASEVGEVAKEILLATDYGQRTPQASPELAEEIGDALYSLLALAEACEVDAETALGAAMDKYEHRLRERGEAGSMTDDQAPGADNESPTFEALQQTLGHQFANPAILRRALTHPSYVNEHPHENLNDNQRLEFLGDAVLDFIAAAWVYRRHTDFAEGRMTRLRAALVRTETLARLAREVGIREALRLGYGEEEGHGRERDANLCDAFEAVVGALYLDGGMAAASDFAEPLLAPIAEEVLSTAADQDAKSRLQEWSQADLSVTPRYRIVAEKGPDHEKTFVAEALLGQDVVGRGEGHSKQAAEQSAAQAAWRALRQPGAAASGALPRDDS